MINFTRKIHTNLSLLAINETERRRKIRSGFNFASTD